jgi:shikimate kinase
LPQMTDEIASPRPPVTKGGRRNSSNPERTDSPARLAVSLVGFMGAGKTTVGQALAGRLGWRFEDLDGVIQMREGRSIEQIFQQQGEPVFRDLERLVMSEILTAAKSGPLVLALGGGAFCFEQIQEMLRNAETPSVFLDAPVEELFRRSEQPEVVRPLRRDRDQFRQLYEQRRPAYLRAQLRIETGGKTIAAVVEEIVCGLNLDPRSEPGSGVCE